MSAVPAEIPQIGRPSAYTPELLAQCQWYLSHYEELDHAIPSIAGLATHLKLSRKTLHRWKHEEGKEEFSDILEEILSVQETVLINKGLKGEFNSNICKLALGKHGYADREERTGPDGVPLVPKEIDLLETSRRVIFLMEETTRKLEKADAPDEER